MLNLQYYTIYNIRSLHEKPLPNFRKTVVLGFIGGIKVN